MYSSSEPALQRVSLPLHQRRQVQLVFNVDQQMDAARITLLLPDQVEVDGFPGQRQISWRMDLRQGKNTLQLPLRGLAVSSGELQARLRHGERKLGIRLGLEVQPLPRRDQGRLIMVHRPPPASLV